MLGLWGRRMTGSGGVIRAVISNTLEDIHPKLGISSSGAATRAYPSGWLLSPAPNSLIGWWGGTKTFFNLAHSSLSSWQPGKEEKQKSLGK